MSNDMKELIHILKFSNSQKKVYNTLLKIYKNIKICDNLKFFYENDGIDYIFELLSKPNKHILNISLGILTECCLNSQCRDEILSKNVLKQISFILNHINQDVIYYRCCKLIKNLTISSHICSLLISNKIYESLMSILSNNPSEGTQFMGIRCIREIFTKSNNNDKKLIIQRSDTVEVISKYLSSDNKQIQKSVLQIVFCLSSSRFDVIFEQFVKRDILKLIISKIEDFPSLILKIIFYLSEIKILHFELAKIGILEVIFPYIRSGNLEHLETDAENNIEIVLQILSKLCSEPKCREKLCNIPDAFNSLLDIIENSSTRKIKNLSILILSSFIYDGFSLKKLVKHRLIHTLISYLQLIVNELGLLHDNNEVKNNERNVDAAACSSGRISPLSDYGTSLAFSPSPRSEPDCFSPTISTDCVFSPVYSPIMDEFCDSEDDSEKLSVDSISCNSDAPLVLQADETVKMVIEEKIFILLKHLMYINDEPLYDFCAKRTWETLLDYLTLIRKNNVLLTSLLSAIAGNSVFFNQLLQTQFALVVHKKLCRSTHVDCCYCQELNKCGIEILVRYQNVAESSYGNQILRNEVIRKGYSKSSVSTIITILHVVKNIVQLEEYLMRYKILGLIIDSLNENYEFALFEEKIASLNSVAGSVCLENPRVPIKLCKKCDVGSLTKEATVNFLLDDGSLVSANKNTICEKSEFFEAMFRFGFKEAKQTTIRLSNISSDCLTLLFRLLYSYCDCILPKNVMIFLELIEQSDKFLIHTLSEKLLNIAMNNILDYENCSLIYDWAVECGSLLPSSSKQPICKNIIKYALIENITFNQRVNAFKMLLSSRYKQRVLEDIMQVIEFQLKCNDVKRKLSIELYKKDAAKRFKLNN